MASMNTGNTGLSPFFTPNTGNSGIGLSHCPANFSCSSYQNFHLNQSFAPWEVALTVIAAAIMVAVVVMFVRRVRGA
jgi:hypothetical protein